MQLSHMSDRPLDLKTQMQDLTRNTTDILLLEIPMIDNSNERRNSCATASTIS